MNEQTTCACSNCTRGGLTPAEWLEWAKEQMGLVYRPLAEVQDERAWVGLTLEEIEDIIKSNITITDPNLYEGVYAVAVDIEHAVMEKNR